MASPLSSELLLAQNVPPKAVTGGGTTSTVQDSTTPAATAGQGGSLSSFLPMIMMVVVFIPIFLMMNRKQKKESAARGALKKGDRVMTNAGLIGELVERDDRIAKVKIAPGVTVQIVANTVTPFAEPEPVASKDLKEAAEKK